MNESLYDADDNLVDDIGHIAGGDNAEISLPIIPRLYAFRCQEIKCLQDQIRSFDATISKLANLTRQAEATREELKARHDELCEQFEPVSKLQAINDVRKELMLEGVDPDGPYMDYATGNYGLV
ncbi:MAG: hypothetical protein H8D67_22985 [Deltaproteobacteria bacterium]|nr:hypothetical protein [Deltaproteobacteria bacterium]